MDDLLYKYLIFRDKNLLKLDNKEYLLLNLYKGLISSEILEEYLEKFVEEVLSNSFSYSYLGVIVYNPLMNDPEKYGLISNDKNNMSERIQDYMGYLELGMKGQNAFSIIYQQDCSEVLSYCIRNTKDDSEREILVLNKNEKGWIKLNIDEKWKVIIDAHKVFQQESELSYTYYVPTVFSTLYNRGTGGIIFITDKLIDDFLWFKVLYLVVQNFLAEFGVNYAEVLLKYEQDKSAKAAIMSRNMSHNLGSHVMAYLKQKLISVENIVQEKALFNIVNDLDQLEKLKNSCLHLNAEPELPFLVGLGKFIAYLQERQDFIATISTDYIPYYALVNFKDAIYDELNPDYRYERHQDRSGCRPENILLDNIARSEGLGRKEIEIKFGEFNGLNDGITINKERQEYVDGQPWKDLNRMRKIDVFLPGGVVGRQAIFSILENLIRNAAKHGEWKEQKALEVTIEMIGEISEVKDEDLRNYLLQSNYNGLKYSFSYAQMTNDFYIVTLTDNLKNADKALEGLWVSINEKLIDEKTGQMKETNKGIKEMRISAAWLRNITEEENLSLPVLSVRNSHDNLQYIFCLQKPKKVAVVLAESDSQIVKEKSGIYASKYWGIYTVSDFKNLTNKSFELIVAIPEVIEQIRLCSPQRVLTVDKSFMQTLLTWTEDKIGDDGLAELYEKWLQNKYKDLPDIFVFDNKVWEKYRNGSSLTFYEKVKIEQSDKPELMEGSMLYRTHHQTFKDFKDFMESGLSTRFVEGISGHNSTDRLLRNSELNKLWYLKNMNAAICQVGIFDERLFEKITHLNEKILEKLLTEEGDKFECMVDSLKPGENWTLKIVETLGNLSFEQRKEIGKCCEKKDKEELKVYLGSHYADHQKNDVSAKCLWAEDHMSLVYAQKGVFVFNILWEELYSRFVIIGYHKAYRFQEGKYQGKVIRIGTISKIDDENGQMDVKIELDSEEFIHFFDYLTIHQGVLDKLYSKFNIKKKEASLGKIILTTRLFEKFSRYAPETIAFESITTESYYPGLIMHSGRSKPSETDMPQKQPFIQYAALEDAVNDCKYSLVELLDFARYEPQNSDR